MAISKQSQKCQFWHKSSAYLWLLVLFGDRSGKCIFVALRLFVKLLKFSEWNEYVHGAIIIDDVIYSFGALSILGKKIPFASKIQNLAFTDTSKALFLFWFSGIFQKLFNFIVAIVIGDKICYYFKINIIIPIFFYFLGKIWLHLAPISDLKNISLFLWSLIKIRQRARFMGWVGDKTYDVGTISNDRDSRGTPTKQCLWSDLVAQTAHLAARGA